MDRKELKERNVAARKNVADLLGDMFMGIYHLDYKALKRVDWSNDFHIKYIYYGDLATIDFDRLTILVVLAHDRMIRVSIQGVGPQRMKIIFHQREKRKGSMMERCPTIEDHIKEIREYYD